MRFSSSRSELIMSCHHRLATYLEDLLTKLAGNPLDGMVVYFERFQVFGYCGHVGGNIDEALKT